MSDVRMDRLGSTPWTAGHFHAECNRAEYYAKLCGEGGLVLMDQDGNTRWQPMCPGSAPIRNCGLRPVCRSTAT